MTTTWNACYLMAVSNARGNEAEGCIWLPGCCKGDMAERWLGSRHDFPTDAYHMHKAEQPETQDVNLESGMMDMK